MFEPIYLCDAERNIVCTKEICYLYGGPCWCTSHKQYAKELIPVLKLETMIDKQREFQTRLNPDFNRMTVEQRVAFIKEHSIHLNQEVNEMLYELPFFKPWKDYSGMTSTEIMAAFDKAKMECVDAWHFFMNIMIALGFTADSFYEMYMAKNKENHRRQDVGYTADVSYKDQSVEEVMDNG